MVLTHETSIESHTREMIRDTLRRMEHISSIIKLKEGSEQH